MISDVTGPLLHCAQKIRLDAANEWSARNYRGRDADTAARGMPNERLSAGQHTQLPDAAQQKALNQRAIMPGFAGVAVSHIRHA